MDRKIKIVGIEDYIFDTPDGQKIEMSTVHYLYNKKSVQGSAVGRFSASRKFLDRYDVQMNGDFIGVFYTDSTKKEKCAALFVEGK